MSLSKIIFDVTKFYSDDLKEIDSKLIKLNYVNQLLMQFGRKENLNVEIVIFGSMKLGNFLRNSEVDVAFKYRDIIPRNDVHKVSISK